LAFHVRFTAIAQQSNLIGRRGESTLLVFV